MSENVPGSTSILFQDHSPNPNHSLAEDRERDIWRLMWRELVNRWEFGEIK